MRVEISYCTDRKTLVKRIEEIPELHDLIEHGPDWTGAEGRRSTTPDPKIYDIDIDIDDRSIGTAGR
jgi:hypothetical protein